MTNTKNRSNLLLVLAVLVALNGAAQLYFGRADLSEGKIFTLSDYSRQVVRELEDPLLVKVYFSEDVGPQYNQNRTYIKDMLEDYRAWSHGNLQFEMVDPHDKENFDAEARKAGVQPVQAQVVENDQISVRLVYMGMSFLAGDRKETLPFLGDVNGLEYTMTSTIRRLSSPELVKVGVIQGHGEPGMEPDPMAQQRRAPSGPSIGTLTQLLRETYTVEETLLDQPVDPAIHTLVWVAPQEPVSELELYNLDQFLMRGGRLAYFADRYAVDIATRQAQPLELNTDDFLAHFGVKIEQDLVGDRNCGAVTVRQQGGGNPLAALFGIQMRYPLFVELRGFDDEHPVSRKLESTLVAWASSLDTTAFAAARSAGAVIRPLVSTSANTEVQRGPNFDLEPVQQLTPEILASRFNAGPQLIGATVEGSFSSYFAGRALPEGADAAGRLDAGAPTSLAVMADGDFVQDSYSQQGDNLALVQNIVDWLSQDEGLISIRSKTITSRPLVELEPGTRKLIKWFNILAVPVIFILFGLVRWMARRRRAGLA
ncbi:MAG: Gldg family protein [Calditrichaeota bacterium]|nr:Gldg family protein [Calditrichota bacterium]